MSSLPIEQVLPDLRRALLTHSSVVLTAEPGAGKTTRVPLALIGEPWLAGLKIIMLEPRRLAALRAAEYMAGMCGEEAGGTVGYRIRGETRIGARTRVEVVTEGVLTRMLQDDPALLQTGLLIFDEFHERSIHADLGLALALDVRDSIRPDLKILVMSATLADREIARMLGDAPVISGKGRTHPVSTVYLGDIREGFLERSVAAAVRRAIREQEGDLLVFLPGRREIRSVETLLAEADLQPGVAVHPLHGEAPLSEQRAALATAPPGVRKVILSTSVAETSLTIDGIRVVIDSGVSRTARFDPRRGMSGLVTVPVSQASADQRRGRAGRQGPGVCYRLWTESRQQQLPRFSPPEILSADLAPLALELARWGTPGGEGLRFLDPLPAAHFAQARGLLRDLGALDRDGKLTAHGRRMAEIPVHPRLANMLLSGRTLGLGHLACDVAAILEERDLLRNDRGADIDLHARWQALRSGKGADRSTLLRVRAQVERLKGMISPGGSSVDETKLGLLLALAYPERVAKQRSAEGNRYQLSGGPGAVLPKGSALIRQEYLAVGEVDGAGTEVRVYMAEPLTEKDLTSLFADRISTLEEVHWDEREESVVARRLTRFGALILSEANLPADVDRVRSTMLEGIRRMGIGALPWNGPAISVRVRSEWLRRRNLGGADWPDLSDETLTATLDRWLGPFLHGVTRRAHLERLPMEKLVRRLFTHTQLQRLDRMAPTHLTLPTGTRAALQYAPDGDPVLGARLQEMFGQTETPTVAGGRVPVILHLLSPAGRPLAVTQDLPSFWKNAYPDVRKDMRGRYPRHHWPENPLEARPTRRTKRS